MPAYPCNPSSGRGWRDKEKAHYTFKAILAYVASFRGARTVQGNPVSEKKAALIQRKPMHLSVDIHRHLTCSMKNTLFFLST